MKKLQFFNKSNAAHIAKAKPAQTFLRVAQVAAIAALGFGVAFQPNFASAASQTGLAVTSDVTSISSGGKVVLTASQPVVSANGLQSQTLIQKIDPAKTHLTSEADITYPHGWALSVSFDNGATFTDVLPTTATGTATSWDAVNAVKATGDIVSNGDVNGRQAVTGTGTLVTPESGQFAGGGTGDGWNVFFDNDNHVFRISHHSAVAVSCYTRRGASCGPGWTFAPGNGFTTAMASPGLVDNDNHHIWLAVAQPSTNTSGFLCVDISDFTVGPSLCGGSAGTAYQSLGGMARGYGTVGMTAVGSKYYEWSSAGEILCVDTAANGGAGAPCPNQPYTDPNIAYAGWSYTSTPDAWIGTMVASNGKIYGSAAASPPLGGPNGGTNTTLPEMRVLCIDPATDARCAGWETAKLLPTGTNFNYVYELPNSSGRILGVCFQRFSTTGGEDATCYKEDGSALAQNATLAHSFDAVVYNGPYISNGPRISGTHVYWSGGDGVAIPSTNTINCFDTATNSVCDGGWPIVGTTAYTVTVDPENSNCLWTNDNYNHIKAFNVLDTSAALCGPPPGATFAPEAIVPRLGCSNTDALDSWGDFTITSPAPNGYDSAKLTVYDSNGAKISGYTSITPTSVDGSGNPVFDLSGLATSISGQHPAFYIELLGRTSSADIQGSLQAIGQSPQLCTTLTASQTVCQDWLGPLVDPVWSYKPETTGSVQSGSDPVTNYGAATVEIGAKSLDNPLCGGQLQGAAKEGAKLVSGATVTLLDQLGAPILVNGQPVTAITAADGSYTFGYVAAGTYRVAFATIGSTAPISANLVSGATGSVQGLTDAVDGVATSNAIVIEPAVDGVVDAEYLTSVAEPTDKGGSGGGGDVLAFTGALLNSPLMFTGFTLTLLGLAGYGVWYYRKRKASQN